MNTFLHSLKVLFVVLVSVFSTHAFGQISQNFNATGWGGSYGTYTLSGWKLNESIREATSSNIYEGAAALRFNSTGTRNIISPISNGGIGVISFKARQWSTADGTVSFKVYVSGDGVSWGTEIGAGTLSSTTYNIFTYTVNDLSKKYLKIEISSGKRSLFDDIQVIVPTGYSLTYNGNGNTSGSVPASQPDLASGAEVTLANNTGSLVRTGFTFNGWNTVQNGGAGTHYAAGASYTMPSSNVTMYADWKALPKLSPSTTSIAGFDYNLGAGPVVKTFTLSGTNLNGSDVGLLVGGTDFQISSDDTTYSDFINYPAYDGSLKTVYVRLKAGLPAAAYTDQLLISGGGAADAVVNLSGTVKAPVLTANPVTLSGFTYYQGDGPSNVQSFSLSGQNLSGSQNVEILPGENWEVSADQTTWFTYDNPLILNNYAGVSTPIYVRLKAGLAEGVYNNASNDIATIIGYEISGAPEVTLSGQVNATLPPPVVTGATVSGTYDTALNYTVTASNNPTSFAIVSGALPDGLSLNTTTGVISGTPTAAGSFTAQISAANYSGTGSPAELIFNISKKTQAVTFGALSDKVYGDSPFTLSATADSGLEVTYSSSHPEVASVSGTTVTVIGAGITTITATQAGNSNYASATAVQDLKVTARPLTVSGLTANHKVQDGTTAATLSGTASLTNVVAGDEGHVTLSGTPVGTFASASPGTAVAVTVTGLSLKGDKAVNYTLTPLVLSANITALGIPVATKATNVEQNSFTANWNEVSGATEYELEVYTKLNNQKVILNETFDALTGTGFTGGNDGSWSGTIATATIPTSFISNGWGFSRANGGYQCIKAGSGSGTGIVTTPALSGLDGNAVLTFRAGSWGTDSTVLKISISGGGTISGDVNNSLINGAFTSYTVKITGGTSSTKITFESLANSKRFFIDDIKVISGEATSTQVSGSPFTITAPSVSHEVTGVTPQTEYYYTIKSKSGTVLSPKSNEIKVYPQSVGGTVSPDQTLCSGATPSDLTLSGHFGDILHWQSSTDSTFSSAQDMKETGAVLSGAAIGPLSVTTYFRAVVQSGDNPLAYSAYATVTVIPLAAAGSISEDQSICYGAQPADLSLSGSTGTIQWQWSTDNVTFTDINGAASAVLSGDLVGSLTQTTYFRAQLTSGSCSTATSDVITVTVVPNVTVGTVSENQSICYGVQPADLSLTGSEGAIQWQRSADNVMFTNINEATSALLSGDMIGSLTETTYFRAQLSNGVCTPSASEVITVTVIPNVAVGTVSEDQTICYNTQPSYLSLTGSTGTVQWEWSTDNETFTDINGATSAVLSGDLVGSLTQTTYFRAQLSSGSCSTGTSDVITVTVVPNVTVGTVSENQSICYGTQPADLSLTGNTGTIQWQRSTDNVTFTDISGATSGILSGDIIGSLTETTYFRAQLSNGICFPTPSDVITVTVIPNVTAGPINSPNNIRLGYTAQLTTAGTAGGTWSSSDTDVATVSETGLVTAVGYGTVDITYTVSSGCGSPVSATVALIINNATTWSGNSWDYGVPDAFVDAIIGGNLTAAEHLVSKTLTINTGIVLTVAADASFTTGDFVNNGTLVVESDGNFVQTEGSINSGSGTATVKRNARMKRLDYTYWGSPVHGSQTLKQFSPGTVDNRFMTYNTIDDTFSTVNPNTTVFIAGKGYAIRASNHYPVWTDPTLESNYRTFEGIFKGQPNNGDINLPLEQTGQAFNLIANPYPSNIDLHALATINSFENKFYFWSNANVGIGGTEYAANNYAVYTGTGGTPAENGTAIPDRYVKVGQGFIVKATTNNLTFTNVMRNNGTGESSFINKGKEAKEVIDRYWLTLASPASSTNTILIGYPEGATNGYDPEFDAEQLGQSTNSFYSVLEDKKLVIQGRQKPMEVTDVVPLGFKGSAAGQYKISLIKKNGIFEGTQKVYLRDKLNNTITNLHAGNYTFSSQAGIIENRFEIMYVDEILGGNEVKTGELAVYRNGEHFEIKSSQKKISEVEVYDLTGKLIMNVTANQNHVVINSSSWVNGVYVLKIHRNGETVSKKVIK